MPDVVGLGASAAQVAPPNGDSRPVGIFGFLLPGPFRGCGDRRPRMCPRVVSCCRSRQAACAVGEARIGESRPGRNHLAEGHRETNRSPTRKRVGPSEHGESRGKVDGPSGLLSMEGILGREGRVPFTGGAVEAVLAEPEGRVLRGPEHRARRRGVRGSAGIGVASGRKMPATTRSGPPKRAAWP